MEGWDVEGLLRAGAALTGSSAASDTRLADLNSVLRRRLSEYHALSGRTIVEENSDLEHTQLDTAKEALLVIENLHRALRARERQPVTDESQPDPSLFGTRDLALVRTLISIVFKWAIEPLLQRITAAIPSTSTSHAVSGARIIDLTGLPDEYATWSNMTSRILALPLADGTSSPLSQSVVTATLLNQHLPDLLLPCVVIGWLPKSLASESMPTGDALRPQVMYLLSR